MLKTDILFFESIQVNFETCSITLHKRSLSRVHVIRRPWKTEPSFRLIQVLDGRGRYCFESKSVSIEQGDFLLLSPGSRRIEGLPAINLFSLHFDLNTPSHHLWLQKAIGHAVVFEGDAEARQVLRNALHDARQTLLLQDDPARARLQMRLVLSLFSEMQKPNQSAIPLHLSAVAARLTLEPQERPSLGQLSQMCSLSERQFRRLFQKYYGQSPARYAICQRITQAETLLGENNFSVKETALSLGYTDPYCFSKQFKQVKGCSPKAYARSQTGS